MQIRPSDRSQVKRPKAEGQKTQLSGAPSLIPDDLYTRDYPQSDGEPSGLKAALTAPFKRGLKKTKALGKKLASGTVTALKVAPSIGALLAAGAVATAEGLLPGREKLSPVEWMALRTPKIFNHTLNQVFGLIGGLTAEATGGLSAGDLFEVQSHMYKALAPVVENGLKRPSHYVSQLASAPYRATGDPMPAFVYLGEERLGDSQRVMRAWNRTDRSSENPFDPKLEGDLAHVWDVLTEKKAESKLPVFFDLDGDAKTFAPTEYIGKGILESMVIRHNEFGDGFQTPGLTYAWLKTRQESFYEQLGPWMSKARPSLHRAVDKAKADMTPPWLGGEGVGPWPSKPLINRAHKTVAKLARASSKGEQKLTDFADALVSLDQDIVTGTMTHWMKLLKGTSSEKRAEVLPHLAKAWVNLNLKALSDPSLVSPDGAPSLRALEGPPPVKTSHRYDRARAVGEVVDHTLDGLGVKERHQFLRALQSEIKVNLDKFQSQDARFSKALGASYDGIDLAAVLRDRHGQGEEELARRLEQLQSAVHGDNGLDKRAQGDLHRHYAVVDWLVNAEVRYGDIQVGLIGQADAFREHPLGVSQFFDQRTPPKVVSLLGPGPTEVEHFGDPSSQRSMKMSIFREGGGGKAMALPTPSAALKAGLKSLDFQRDDGGGNSGGAIPSLFEAAGFTDAEMDEINRKYDFKDFNADAIPLLGGTDPKVRGVNHGGLFSSQKMYKLFYELISKKLGIEGRPVLFRDLPNRLAITTTVLNTDLPADDPLRDLIEDDKRMVFSSENTPNFDVLGVITATTAVPFYFNPPQMHVARSVVNADGTRDSEMSRIQFSDGGVVDNIAMSAYKTDPKEKPLMVMLPSFYEAVDPATGKKVSLSTLDFDDGFLDIVNAKNVEFYGHTMPKVDKFLSAAEELGYNRVLFVQNLSDLDEQTEAIIQGRTPEETEQLHKLADEVKLPHASAKAGRKAVEGWVNRPGLAKTALGGAFELFADGREGDDDEFRWSLRNGSSSVPSMGEEENLLEVALAVGASRFSTSEEQRVSRLFEQPS